MKTIVITVPQKTLLPISKTSIPSTADWIMMFLTDEFVKPEPAEAESWNQQLSFLNNH